MAYTTIKKPSDYFNTVIYAGTGSSHAITVGFQPDWVWIKNRDAGNDHNSYDSIRGATKDLNNNTTNAESTIAEGLKSFDSNGFTVGTNTAHNAGSENYVSWNWLASNTTASNTDGSITSTVSANTVSGFSIVSFTGTGSTATVGHGLGVAPAMIIIKNRDDGTRNWGVYHKSLGSGNAIRLNQTSASFSTTNFWNSTEPTSTVWSMGNQFDVNDSGDNNIAYCFAEKKGFSKFGSYVGNGSSDGSFIYTGFKPAFIITKPTGNISSWNMTDVTRSTFNDGNLERLKANTSDAETSTSNFDILSNGFKLRTTDNDYNPSGGNVIYMAFAEEPLVGDNPATAR